ncbi:MAG: ATP-binding protein [Deltaproteobacteria bacterium]|nr:ATP-binding protein [Deltaproteobacteria bacterium]MBW2015586.1 ATP-binding protein [Deltaproteobacteria bacterium]MBW2128084.1 ATP-binding protein [Deltaproteobacteria bacterium]MBW2302995.1 ATP-binding protein [Deltaproteobacteria bacterium]
MPQLTKTFPIKARDFIRAGEVSIQIQGLLKTIGFEPALIRRVSICAYESEMNVVMHGGDGTLTLNVDPSVILIEVKDDGPGIENIELAFQEGYSTASKEYREMGFGAGMGLPNIKKSADTVEIRSQKGGGTYLKMCFLLSRGDGQGTGK